MCTSQLNNFKECFPKNHRPELSDLAAFWNNGVEDLFQDFAEYILQNYDLRFGVPVWSETSGWIYRVGKSGVYLIKGIQIEKNGFILDGIQVDDDKSYILALEYVKNLYQQRKGEFLKKITAINVRQAERNKIRINREREEWIAVRDRIIPGKYNVFYWPAKLDIYKLKQLYLLDAKGIYDAVLADEVGLILYIRCKYGKEDMERMEKSIIRCHNCGKELAGEGDFRQCSCGYQYSYREYRRNFRRNNMPTGAASKVFDEFIVKWSLAKNYSEKMILIDALLHEFHLSLISGATHRPVAMNFMDGTRRQVEDVISRLARVNK